MSFILMGNGAEDTSDCNVILFSAEKTNTGNSFSLWASVTLSHSHVTFTPKCLSWSKQYMHVQASSEGGGDHHNKQKM